MIDEVVYFDLLTQPIELSIFEHQTNYKLTNIKLKN